MYLCLLLAGLHHCRGTAQTGWLPGSLLPLLITHSKACRNCETRGQSRSNQLRPVQAPALFALGLGCGSPPLLAPHAVCPPTLARLPEFR
uniref:Secreted protein n=1 Tax=Setaria viridis TaxID=4556 RepID=A0A4U6TWK2_SETVI|nr:hypothetical protein SEVIR_7G211700v2 [Setaria viridis]